MYFPHTSVPSPGTTLKGWRLSHSQSNDFPEVDPPNVVDFPRPSLLLPQQHWMSLGRIGTGPHDTHRWHPPLSCGYPFMGGLVLGGLVL
jgi:hypothetical protein